MKRKIVIIISTVFLLFLIAIVSIVLINKDYTNKQIDVFINRYQSFYKYINEHPIYDEGSIDVNANYRGAHGENYPNRYVFDYKLDNDLVYFSNETGYKEYKYDNKIYKLLECFRKLDSNTLKNILKASKIENNRVIVDAKKISDVTGYKINNMSITFVSSNIIKNSKRIDINIDDIKIIVKDEKIDINYKDNSINIKTNSSGYYLSINDTLKMNAFLNDTKNTYSVVIKDKVLRIEVSDTELKVYGGFESAIYNSIELTITNKDTNIVKSQELELNDVPILRYFTNTDLSFWK